MAKTVLNRLDWLGGALHLAFVKTWRRDRAASQPSDRYFFAGNGAQFGPDLGGIPVLVNSESKLPATVTNSKTFSGMFSVSDIFGQRALSYDRVMTVSIVNYTLAPGATGTISAPPLTTVTLLFDTSPVVALPVYHTIVVEHCQSSALAREIDGNYYCLTQVKTSVPTQIAITVVAGVCVVAALVLLAWLYYHRNKSAIKRSSVTFGYLTTIGAIFMFTAAIMWVYVSEATCALRVWLIIIGFVLCYGALFVKEYRLCLILKRKNPLKAVKITDTHLIGYIGASLLVELIITAIWFIITPFGKRVQLNLAHNKITYTCTSTKTEAFLWILFGLNMAILVLGCILSWYSRNMPSNFNEAKQILFSIYNVTLTIIVVAILAQVFRTSPEAVSLVVSIGLLFSTLVTLGALFGPKVQLVANVEAVKRAVIKNIKNLEQDLSWQRHALEELSTANQSRRSSITSATSSKGESLSRV